MLSPTLAWEHHEDKVQVCVCILLSPVSEQSLTHNRDSIYLLNEPKKKDFRTINHKMPVSVGQCVSVGVLRINELSGRECREHLAEQTRLELAVRKRNIQ
jgi:hypothetical protein